MKRSVWMPPAITGQPLVRYDGKQAAAGLYDIELWNLDQLKGYSSVDCHLVVYPYGRTVTAGHLRVLPYEEYVADIISRQRSVYIRSAERGQYLFGALLALALVAVFVKYRPVELLSLESIVSAMGVYIVGKELWDDIEQALQHVSSRWKLRYVEGYYPYQLGGRNTLSQYSELAKELRHGRRSLLPERIDSIQQSNSQTVRMRFESQSLREYLGKGAHIASLHVDGKESENFRKKGFLFGVKVSLNRRLWGLEKNLEFFQSLDRNRPGCLDGRGSWREGQIFWRRTWRLGKLKFFRDSGTVEGRLVESANMTAVRTKAGRQERGGKPR